MAGGILSIINQKPWDKKFIFTYLPKFQNGKISHKNLDFHIPLENQMYLHSPCIPDSNHCQELRSSCPFRQGMGSPVFLEAP